MSFMERARALYHRDDLVRAAFVLAEGIKREPGNEEALNWFLQLYVEELEGPGLEQELLRVLDTQPDGEILFEGIRAELTRRQQPDRLAALNRVRSLRRRAEANEPTRGRPPAEPEDPIAAFLDDDDPIRALEETAARRRRRRLAAPVTEPLVPLQADEPAEPADPELDLSTTRRRRRRRPRAEGSPQGVLPLETTERAPVDSWRGFQGVAADLDPRRLPAAAVPSVVTDRHVPVEGPKVRRSEGSKVRGPGAAGARGSESLGVRGPERAGGRGTRAPEAAEPESVDLREPAASIPSEEADLDPVIRLSLEGDDPRSEHALVQTSEDFDAKGRPVRAGLGAFDQLLTLEGDEAWSFGEDGAAPPAIAPTAPPPRPTGRRLRRGKGVVLARATQSLTGAGDGVRAVGRGLRWACGGRRGPLILAFVGVLALGGFGYRACTRFSAAQLAEADEDLRLAQGDSLHHAVELYTEHVEGERSPEGERLDFARALLEVDFGEAADAPGYEPDEALTAWGVGALVLHHVATGNLPVARALGEEAVERFADDWVAHWTRGRVAVAESNWERAGQAFERAADLEPNAALPTLGLLDLALRAGRDEQVEAAAEALETTSPDHPLIAVARATVAFGVSPLETRVASLQATLPDPSTESVSLRTRELIDVLQARQALAAWQLDQVAQIMRGLRERRASQLGVRASLLDAVLAARRYRLQDAIAALEAALNAAPAGSPATVEVRDLAATVFVDLGRPDLALGIVGEGAASPMVRADLFVDAGRESDALRTLGQLLDRPDTQQRALRRLVDFHLRRGVADRARLRAAGLHAPAAQAYAAARMAADEGDWTTARDQAEQALRLEPRDRESLAIWSRAMAELGFAERGIERIDEQSARSVLVGEFDRERLDVLVASRRAPRETLSEFASLLESTEPTSMTRLVTLARAYEAIGDLERARDAAERVVAGEPANREMHALLGRIYQSRGDVSACQTHLHRYLELAPESEPTDWARQILQGLDES